MTISLEMLTLAVIQGVTEFLPVSSTAHLILVSEFFNKSSDFHIIENLTLEVFLHSGTLLAVIIYFRKTLLNIILSPFNKNYDSRKLFYYIIVASIPVAVIGFYLNDYVDVLRNPYIIAFTTFAFGLLLVIAERKSRSRDLKSIKLKDSVLIGLSEALALIPGVSRSGVTASAGMLLGMTKQVALKFSFLISIPVLVGSIFFKLNEVSSGSVEIDILPALTAVFVSFVVAILSIHYLLKFIERIGFMPFFIYRSILAIFILIVFV